MIRISCMLCLLCAVEEYLFVVKAPGQQLTEAQTRTPLLGPTGPSCTLSFDFALTGNLNHIGERLNVSIGLLAFWKDKAFRSFGGFFCFCFFFCGCCRRAVRQGDWQHAGHAAETVGVHRKDGNRWGGMAAGQPDYRSQKTSFPGQPYLFLKLQYPQNSSAFLKKTNFLWRNIKDM